MPGKKIVYGAVEPFASIHVLAPSNVLIYAALFCCNVFWGGGALVSKLGIHGASPLVFELCREALSSPIMLLGARAMGGKLLPDREDRLEVLLVSSILIVAQLCFFVGLKHSSPSHCAAWQSMLPVLTTVASTCLRKEQATPAKWVGVSSACCGALLMSFCHNPSSSLAGEVDSNSGHVFIVLQVCLGTAFIIMSERVAHKYGGVALTGWVFAIGSVFLGAVHCAVMRSEMVSSYICEDKDFAVMARCLSGTIHIPGSMFLPLSYEILFCTMLGWCLFNWANGHAASSTVGLMTVVQAVSAMVIGVVLILIKGSQWADMFSIHLPSSLQLFGVLLICLGLCVNFVHDQFIRKAAEAHEAEPLPLDVERSQEAVQAN